MAIKTGIEWSDATWNCWRGCHKLSVGCTNCYMFREQRRHGRDPNVVVRSKTTFNDPLKWAKSGKLKPGSRIFTCSWSDFFIEEADEWRKEAWGIIRRTPQFWYLILTKRPVRMLNELMKMKKRLETIPRNVVWMVTTENQDMADKRILYLLKVRQFVPEAILGVSAEPLLGSLTLKGPLSQGLSWIICGGESGGKEARPMHPYWARALRDECQEAGTPYFFKQHGAWMPINTGDEKGFEPVPISNLKELVLIRPDGLLEYDVPLNGPFPKGQIMMARVGKKAAGRILDGRTWDEIPEELEKEVENGQAGF